MASQSENSANAILDPVPQTDSPRRAPAPAPGAAPVSPSTALPAAPQDHATVIESTDRNPPEARMSLDMPGPVQAPAPAPALDSHGTYRSVSIFVPELGPEAQNAFSSVAFPPGTSAADFVPVFIPRSAFGTLNYSGGTPPPPVPVPVPAPAPTPSAAARPGVRTAGLSGPGSVGRNRGLGNFRGRGYIGSRGDRGGGFRGGVNRNQRTDNSANAPRISAAGSIDRDTGRGPSALTCASRNPEDNAAAAHQVMRNTGARRYTSVTRGVPEGVRALAQRRQWLRSVMFSDSDEPNRRAVDDLMNLDTHESRATDARDPCVANVDVPQERATADEAKEDSA
ncbi:uncharacterized protein FIESC28_06760 [Fusarium coffeatum]|uniref:Uncharacterized protein n=1 Tax=Fusarium coffeatum TaxID=231269 RepID=A0A366RKN0_9HYPO|nr:uncharacterized protein FIESC28_06760 [Fusarium coffeatum]RBR16845.1 hypothetical protein FIESC28_06760 [Fusarium coffeatum]